MLGGNIRFGILFFCRLANKKLMKTNKSKTSVRLMLNKSRQLNNGTFPLVFQIIHCRRKCLLYTGFHVKEEEFDVLSGVVRCVEGSIFSQRKKDEINRMLKREHYRITKRIKEKENTGLPLTVDDLLEGSERKSQNNSLLQYFDIQIARKKGFGKDGIAAAYHSTRLSLERYLSHLRSQASFGFTKTDIRLNAIDSTFVKYYEEYLYGVGVSENTVRYYLRNFRTIYNRAVASGEFAQTVNNPCAGVHAKPCHTAKRALSDKDMRRISMLCLSGFPELSFSRDLYLFSFCAQGMAFVDIAYLKKENINCGVLSYTRHKSGQLIRILVTDEMQALMDRYPASGEFLFPLLNASSFVPLYQQYRLALAKMNRHLKRRACMLDVNVLPSTYTARLTWATLARDCGAPISAISAGLGHTSEEMTRVYLKNLDINVLAQVNRNVTKLLKSRENE